MADHERANHDAANYFAHSIAAGEQPPELGGDPAHCNLARAYLEDHAEVERLREALGRAEREARKMRIWLDAFCSGRTHGSCDHGDCEACMADTIRRALLTKGENDDD